MIDDAYAQDCLSRRTKRPWQLTVNKKPQVYQEHELCNVLQMWSSICNKFASKTFQY